MLHVFERRACRAIGQIRSSALGARDQHGCHSSPFIVQVLRARRGPGRSLPIPPPAGGLCKQPVRSPLPHSQWSLPREQDSELDAQGPVRTRIRSNNIRVCLQARVEGLVSESKHLPYPSPERYRPFVSVFPFPVSRDDWRTGEIPTLVKIVIDGILREELAYARAILATGKGPHVVCEETQDPGPFDEEYGSGGPRTPLPRPQGIVGGCGKLEDRTRSPGPRA